MNPDAGGEAPGVVGMMIQRHNHHCPKRRAPTSRTLRNNDDDDDDAVVRHWIAALHASLTTKQRLTLLRRWYTDILQDDNANDNRRCRAFVAHGGLRALLLQLGLVLETRVHGGTVHELHSLLHALTRLLHGCSSRGSSRTTSTTTTTDVRPTLLDALDEANALALLAQAWRRRAGRVLVPALAHWISACATGTALLLQNTNTNSGGGTLLQAMLAVWTTPECCSSSSSLDRTLTDDDNDEQVQSQLMGLWKNISYFDRQATLLTTTPLFVTALMTTTQAATATQVGPASAIWRNLALTPLGRTRLQDCAVEHVLYTLATHERATVVVRRNVLSTINTLSMDHEFCLACLLYGDGLYMHLMEAWLKSKDGVVTDDTTTRKRAARTVRLWVSHANAASLVVQCASLMGQLSTTAVQDPSVEVRNEAAEAFGRCASWITSPMPQHQAVLQALTVLCQSAPASIVARAIKGQAARPPNRLLLLEQPVLVARLIAIAGSQEADVGTLARLDACTALAYLVAVPDHPQRRLLLAPHYPLLLDALLYNFPSLPATETMVALAADAANRTLMVRHETLLKGLVRCAAQAAHHPHKEGLKQTILLLVEEL